MQAMTIAIGKSGIDFFTQKLVAQELCRILSTIKPSDKTISIGRINIIYSSAEDIVIKLTEGKLVNFNPVFQSVSQKAGGTFPLVLTANNFSAQYQWEETYQWTHCWGGHIPGCDPTVGIDKKFTYPPEFYNFAVTVDLQFQYNKQEWEIDVSSATPNQPGVTANIPADSIIQKQQDDGCLRFHLNTTTVESIDAIDFASPVKSLIKKIVASIPSSGNLGGGIVYDFSLGDSGLLFPNDQGIQMGVKGGAKYDEVSYPGSAPPDLSLPLPPDTHHLNIYVSDYEVDALYWAYYKAEKLNLVVNPSDLTDPKILKVATYVTQVKSLKPYQAFSMQAHISPNAAPVVAFQSIWDFTGDVIAALKEKLPTTKVISDFLNGIDGNVYVSQSSLEDFMKDANVSPEYFETIEGAAEIKGMVVTSDLNFDLVILGKENPDIKFSVQRTDVLSNLRLGIGVNNTQTMQYDFINVTFGTTFISSTVPGFDGADFGSGVWVTAGEPKYEEALTDMGKTGVPLPIMEDFQFDFSNSELSVQQGYISILANVLYK